MPKKKRRKIYLYIPGAILLAIVVFIFYFKSVTRIDPPTDLSTKSKIYERLVIEPGFLKCNKNWLNHNDYGLWELYIEGGPTELGVINGILSQELIQEQEDAFVEQIKVMIPSESYLKFLKYFLAWFNKDLDDYIKQEYLLEIYGISGFASENYGFIGPKYDRILNYHAAHDIGHALQNMNLVECTAFGVWDERSVDSTLLIGRNFDFYVGDDFAINKIIAFVDPEKGYRFASITWAGMIGVVSGMNEKGLSITLNSAKSDIPFGARTPVSIIAREILQYASNIEEAVMIASARKSFVSESFLIGSAADHKAVVIEKSPDKTVVFDPDTNFIVLTNHFQSDSMINDPLNVENMENKTSVYRHERVMELLKEKSTINYLDAAQILRDRKGKGGKNIGNGNELAINQLIAHHSIIFEPENRRLWISTAPWQLGSYLCYDLDSIFQNYSYRSDCSKIFLDDLQIPDDPFLMEKYYQDFITYKKLLLVFQQAIKGGDSLSDEELIVSDFIVSNPEYFHVYYILGQYFQEQENVDLARKYYNLALTKEVSSEVEKENIIQRLEECYDE